MRSRRSLTIVATQRARFDAITVWFEGAIAWSWRVVMGRGHGGSIIVSLSGIFDGASASVGHCGLLPAAFIRRGPMGPEPRFRPSECRYARRSGRTGIFGSTLQELVLAGLWTVPVPGLGVWEALRHTDLSSGTQVQAKRLGMNCCGAAKTASGWPPSSRKYQQRSDRPPLRGRLWRASGRGTLSGCAWLWRRNRLNSLVRSASSCD